MTNPFEQPGKPINTADRKIWWLASYPKSGNTWVRMFLNCYATKFPIGLNSAYQFVVSDLKPEIYQMMMPRPITEMSILEQFMYTPGALLNLIKLANTPSICVKTHNAKATVAGMLLIPPMISNSAIYILRDPRDLVISASKHFGTSINEAIIHLNDNQRAGQAAFGLHHMFMSWSSHVKSWTTENKDVDTFILKYEDLLESPTEAFAMMLDFLGMNDLPDYEERLKFAVEETTFAKLQAREKEEGFVEKANGKAFFNVGTSGHWKKILTDKQVARIEKDHGEVMKLYGYL